MNSKKFVPSKIVYPENSILSKLQDTTPILEEKTEGSIESNHSPSLRKETEKNLVTNNDKSMDNMMEDKTNTTVTSKKSSERIELNEGIDIIKEATKIMAERHKKTGENIGKVKAKTQQILENREICMKNYLIRLLKERRMEINDKELAITKALKESELRLEKDYKNFLRLMEDQKNEIKKNDSEYLALKNNNDLKKKKEKELETENNQTKGELERTVKSIMNYKDIAVFVHNVVDVPFPIMKESDKFEKEKDYEVLASKIIKDFSKIDIDYYDPGFFDDINLFTGKFQELEDKVLKLMQKQDNDNKEYQISQKTQVKEIEDLEKKIKIFNEEKTKLSKENEKETRALKSLEHLNLDDNCKEYYDYIIELFDIIDPSFKKARKKEEAFNPIWANKLLDKLREKEADVMKKIAKLEDLDKEDNSRLKKEIIERKEANKKESQAQKQLENKKRNNL